MAGRSASTNGWRKSERSAGWQRPRRTRPPVAAARSATASRRRVLPMPASPSTSTSAGVPAAPSPAQVRSAWASSGSRPTSRARSTAVLVGRLGREVRLAQHGDVQVGGLAVRGRAELFAQPGGQVVVRRQRRARPAVGDEGAHEGRARPARRTGRRPRSRRRPEPPRAGSSGVSDSASRCRARRRRASASPRTLSTQSASSSSTRAGWLPSSSSAELAAATASAASPAAARRRGLGA